MGLKNNSAELGKAQNILLKYNGIEVLVKPGEVVDVRDFNINNAEVFAVEEVLIDKHVTNDEARQRMLVKSKTLSNMSDAQINAEIARLQEVIDGMKMDVEPREKEIVELTTQIADMTPKLGAALERITELEGMLDEADPKWRKPAKAPKKD